MPSIPAPPRAPTYGQGDTMLDLIMRQGQVQAQGHQQSGDLWGNAIAGIGQTLGAGIQQYGEQQQRKKQSIAFEAAIQSGDPRQIISVLGPERGPAVVTALRTTTPDAAKLYKDRAELFRDGARGILASPEDMQPQGYTILRQSYLQNGFAKPEELPESFEEALPSIHQAANYGREPAKPKEAEAFTLSAGQQRFGPDGQPIANVPAAPADAPRPQVVGRSLVGPDGRVIYRDPAEPRAPREDNEPLVAVIDDTGQSVLVPRRQAAGRRPASNREQSSTGAEKTALSFYNDARQAATDADAVADKLGNSYQLKYAPNIAQTDEQQQYWQAVRSFTEARLRKRSGAAIPEYEIEKDAKMYFQQPGDSDAVKAQKKASRERTIDGIRIESGRAYAEYYGEPAPRNQPGAVPPPAPGASDAAQPVRVTSDADYARVPVGAQYTAPDGSVRTKR